MVKTCSVKVKGLGLHIALTEMMLLTDCRNTTCTIAAVGSNDCLDIYYAIITGPHSRVRELATV